MKQNCAVLTAGFQSLGSWGWTYLHSHMRVFPLMRKYYPPTQEEILSLIRSHCHMPLPKLEWANKQIFFCIITIGVNFVCTDPFCSTVYRLKMHQLDLRLNKKYISSLLFLIPQDPLEILSGEKDMWVFFGIWPYFFLLVGWSVGWFCNQICFIVGLFFLSSLKERFQRLQEELRLAQDYSNLPSQ